MPTTEADVSLVREIESALITTWPALQTAVDGAWLVRMADGFTGRANSVTILDPADDRDGETRIAWAEGLFEAQNLVPCFRETPLTPARVLQALRDAGYRESGETHMLLGALEVSSAGEDGESELTGYHAADGAWMTAACACSARIAASAGIAARMLANMAAPVRYIAVSDKEGPAAVCQAGIHRDILALHNVATHPEKRRRGHAARAVAAAKAWGVSMGAKRLWIAVETGNAPALSLYRRDDLADIYRYRYWSRA